MAVPSKAALTALKKAAPVIKQVGPIIGPQAVMFAKKMLGANDLKKTAHNLAYDRGGRVGEVTFLDGGRRWVAVDADDKPLAAFPPYDDGSDEALVRGLKGVDFSRCMRAPDPELREARRRQRAQRKDEKKRLKSG